MHLRPSRSPIPRPLLLVPVLALMLLVTGGQPLVVRAQPADPLANGRRLETNGDWEAAEQAYRALLGASGETGPSARLALARLYERWERYSDALDLLRALTGTAGCSLPAASCARAWFQLGSVLQSLGRSGDSVAAYRRAIELGSAAAAYARVESAKMLLANDDTNGALAVLGPLLRGDGPENARRIAYRLAAPVAADLGPDWTATALSYYRAHAALATGADERAGSLWQIGVLERSQGNGAAAAAAFGEIVTRYPGSGQAVDALDALSALGRPAAALDAALVHYRRRNNETARRLYNQVLASGTAAERGIALFYLGALAERRDDTALAIENYGQSYAADPNGRLADEALWARANLYQEADAPASAQADYALIVSRGTDFSRAAEAAFRNGFISYDAGDRQEARSRWQGAIGDTRNGVAATAAFWAGKVAGELGDAAGAQGGYAEAVRRDPNGYYGLRAAAVLAGQSQAPRNGAGALRLPPDDWAGAEAWLAGWAGSEDSGAWAAFQDSDDWRATWELAEAGWYKIALDAFLAMLGRRADQPWLQYRAARALADGGFPRAAYSAAFNIWARWPGGGPEPPALLRLRYPAPWSEVIQREADKRSVDPLLLYAMVRQESAFDPYAGSSAGAFGLTQVVSGTAMDIGRAIGHSVRFSELARPAVALEFGAFYLGAQIRQEGGSVYEGLAAYNGGGTNVDRWARSAGGGTDVDRFEEAIDFTETEAYVRLVTENYAWYRFLYGAADRPSIVR